MLKIILQTAINNVLNYLKPQNVEEPVYVDKTKITETKFQEVAKELGVEVAALKAVAEVESKGSGFLPSGEPKILFEPHIWWKQLIKHGKDPIQILEKNPQLRDILYKYWGTEPYGKESLQHIRLSRAVAVDRDSALESASYGAFQVLGNNWEDIGYASLQDFINDAYTSANTHFNMFVRFIKRNDLVKYLKTKNWEEFARRYNGPKYKENQYHNKLKKAYDKFKGK